MTATCKLCSSILETPAYRSTLRKALLGQTSIPFLGEGLHLSPDHLIAIAEAPALKDMAALRPFLGLTSWFSKFLPNYTTLVEPLLSTNTQAELQWDDEKLH